MRISSCVQIPALMAALYCCGLTRVAERRSYPVQTVTFVPSKFRPIVLRVQG